MKIYTASVFVCTFALVVHSAEVFSAEEEFTLLTITGDLTDKLELQSDNENPNAVINAYYAELDTEIRGQLLTLRHRMDRRLEDYQVAYTAADTAEINEILDDLSFYWASMRTLHAAEYTDGALEQLHGAYRELYEFIRGAD